MPTSKQARDVIFDEMAHDCLLLPLAAEQNNFPVFQNAQDEC